MYRGLRECKRMRETERERKRETEMVANYLARTNVIGGTLDGRRLIMNIH